MHSNCWETAAVDPVQIVTIYPQTFLPVGFLTVSLLFIGLLSAPPPCHKGLLLAPRYDGAFWRVRFDSDDLHWSSSSSECSLFGLQQKRNCGVWVHSESFFIVRRHVTLKTVHSEVVGTHTAHHSSGLGKSVCLRELSGSYSNDTPDVGFHLACSLAKPFRANARSFSSWPFRSLTITISTKRESIICIVAVITCHISKFFFTRHRSIYMHM